MAQSQSVSGWEFVRLIEDKPGYALWVHQDGREKVMGAPRRYRPKCTATEEGIPCVRHALAGEEVCRVHLSD